MKPDQFAKMRAGRVRAAAIKSPAQVPAMVLDGVLYVETYDMGRGCEGCAFNRNDRLCIEARERSYALTGNNCATRDYVYIRAV